MVSTVSLKIVTEVGPYSKLSIQVCSEEFMISE